MLYGCLGLSGLVVIFLFGLCLVIGFGLQSGYLAGTEVLRGGELPERQRTEIAKIVNLRPGERILYFYCAGFVVAEDGNLITNQRVISYEERDGETLVYQAEYGQIVDVEMTPGSFMEDTLLKIIPANQDYDFFLLLSIENGGDKKFYQELLKQWEMATE